MHQHLSSGFRIPGPAVDLGRVAVAQVIDPRLVDVRRFAGPVKALDHTRIAERTPALEFVDWHNTVSTSDVLMLYSPGLPKSARYKRCLRSVSGRGGESPRASVRCI